MYTISLGLVALRLALSFTPSLAAPVPITTGFVKTSGTAFTLDGNEFTVVGENSYWVGLTGLSTSDMNQAFADIAATGSTVVRTCYVIPVGLFNFNDLMINARGFNEVTRPDGIAYYQSWSGNNPTVNTGADGLQNFDNVVAAAKANGLRLIVALTNNWADYGGMDVYVKQILNSDNHDLFYTDASVKAAFKNYVNAFVGRYVNEPTVMAWELANEPRCTGNTGISTGTCTTATITSWVTELSEHVKTIDSNHLVALGDEGFFNDPSAPIYPYQGSEGIDFDANLTIDSIDFGTFHAYPEVWGQKGNEVAFGTQWIADHAKSQASANKPVIMEEFGVTSNQAAVYTAWWNEVLSTGLAGDLIWQAGSRLSSGITPEDEFTIYPDEEVYPLIKSNANNLISKASPKTC